MNDNALDRNLADWLREGPEQGSTEALARALAATRRVSQRPGWATAARWTPTQVTLRRVEGLPRAVVLFAVLVLMVMLVVALAVVGSRPRVPAPFGPAANGLIAYDAGNQVYVEKADHSDRRPIPGGLGVDSSPTFSPDGTRIAFLTSPAEGNAMQLIVTNVDGSGTPVVASRDVRIIGRRFDPISWSPDSGALVFASSDRGIDRLYVALADGTAVAPISDRAGNRETPAWSPDGRLIAYRLRQQGRQGEGLAISRADGSGERVLAWSTVSSAAFSASRWSPDGTRLAYFRKDDHGSNVIGVVDLAGHETLIWARPGNAFSPVWSPDGASIAFVAAAGQAPSPDDTVIVIGADGRNPRSLGYVADCSIEWSPDGTSLFGTTPGDCKGLVTVPILRPDRTSTFALPGDMVGNPSWQRMAP